MTNAALPQAMLKRLEKLSASSKRSPTAIVKQAVQDRLDYEEWKGKKIREGLEDVKAGRVISHEEMVTRMGVKIKASAWAQSTITLRLTTRLPRRR